LPWLQRDDDLHIEIEPVRGGGQVEFGQGVHVVGSVTRMKLRQSRPQGPVLQRGQYPVPEIFVQRHPAVSGSARLHHPRSEHGIAFATDQRLDHRRDQLGRILAVPVQEHDDIEVMFDGEPISGLLIAAVTEIPGVPDHRDRQIVGERPVAQTDEICSVVAGVVADEQPRSESR
jgi:hypothetical protein